MSKAKPQTNGFDDDDFHQVIQEIEEADDEAESIMATARGKVSGIRTRQKNRIKIAKQELQIPSDVLRAVLKQRKLERKLKLLADSVADDLVEVYEDAAQHFGLFADTPLGQAAVAAATARKTEVDKRHDEEQAAGAEALAELTQVH